MALKEHIGESLHELLVEALYAAAEGQLVQLHTYVIPRGKNHVKPVRLIVVPDEIEYKRLSK